MFELPSRYLLKFLSNSHLLCHIVCGVEVAASLFRHVQPFNIYISKALCRVVVNVLTPPGLFPIYFVQPYLLNYETSTSRYIWLPFSTQHHHTSLLLQAAHHLFLYLDFIDCDTVCSLVLLTTAEILLPRESPCGQRKRTQTGAVCRWVE